MRTHRIAALLLAATLALSACTDDGPDPGESMSTWTPSSTPEEPSSSAPPSAEPTEPELPDAATKATEAGARAFITYYWDLINYAQVTGDVKALRKVSGPNCGGCNAGINGIAAHYEDGGQVIGGSHDVSVSALKELTTESESAYAFRATATAAHGDQIIVSSDGTQDVRGPGADTFDLYLLWVDDSRWRLDVMELQ